VVYTYDSSNRWLTRRVQNYNNGTNAWETSISERRSFNASGQMIEQVDFGYYELGPTFRLLHVKLLYSYNAAGNLASVIYQDSLSGNWINFKQELNSYTPNNDLSETITRDWDGANWVNSERLLNNYDGSRNLIETLEQIWLAGGWENDFRTSFSYNPSSLLNSRLVAEWSSGAWSPVNQQFYTYDTRNNLVKVESQRFLSGAWENGEEYLYEYDANDFLTADEFARNWNASAGYYDLRRRNEYRCTAINSVGLEELYSAAVELFPNPLRQGQSLTVKVEAESTYKILNTIWEVLQEGSLQEGINALDFQPMAAGLYHLSGPKFSQTFIVR
jgi:hypothetical protein